MHTGAEGLGGRGYVNPKSDANSYHLVPSRIGLYHFRVPTAQSPLPPFTQGGHALKKNETLFHSTYRQITIYLSAEGTHSAQNTLTDRFLTGGFYDEAVF